MKISSFSIDHRVYWYLFFAISLMKIILLGLFNSDYQLILFQPFIELFLEGVDPYRYYWDNNLLQSFPYPSLMLYLLAFFRAAHSLISLPGTFFFNLITKLPLFLFDLVAFFSLNKIFTRNRKTVLIFYYLSPILIYSTYLHSQLDIIPLSLLILSILLIKSGKNIFFVVIFAVAISFKLNILLVLPIILLYINNRFGTLKSILYLILIILLFYLFNLQFVSLEFFRTVLINNEFSLLAALSIDFTSLRFLVPVSIYGFVHLLMLDKKILDSRNLISIFAIVFGSIVLTLPPAPAWYLWVSIFLIPLFLNQGFRTKKNVFILLLFESLYILYFIVIHNSNLEYLILLSKPIRFDLFNVYLNNLIFTVMNTLMIFLLYTIFNEIVLKNLNYLSAVYGYSIGISGDSAAGKTHLSELLSRSFGTKNVLILNGDDDHKWERNDRRYEEVSHLNPKANNLHKLKEDIFNLKNNKSISRPHYNHSTGKFEDNLLLKSNRIIVINGLHTLFLNSMRDLLDFKIFISTEENLRKHWKFKRDVLDRSYSENDVIRQFKLRAFDSETYIIPQNIFSDLQITYFDNTLTDSFDSSHLVKLGVRLKCDASYQLDDMISDLESEGVPLTHNYLEDLTNQEVIIEGNQLAIDSESIERISNKYLADLQEMNSESIDETELDFIIELFVIKLILLKLKENK